MLRSTIVFMAITFVGILLGVTQLAGIPFEIGKMLLGIFFVFALIGFIASMITDCKASSILP